MRVVPGSVILRYYSIFSILSASLYIFLLACSSSGNNNADHPAHFDPVFQRIDHFGPEQVPEAFRVLDSAYAGFPNPGPMDLARKYQYKLEYFWLRKQDRAVSKPYADSILHVLSGKTTQPGYANEYGKTLLYLGDMLQDEGKLDNAFSLYYEGQAFIQQSGDTCSFNEYNSRLAMVYYAQRKYQQAIPYFKETFNTLGACGQKAYYQFCYQQAQLDNIALCYDHLDRRDSALFFYDSALHYIQVHKTPFEDIPNHINFIQAANAVVYGNKGSLLLRKGDTAAAEQLYKESIRINMKAGNETRDAQITIGKLVELQLAQKRFTEARSWLQTLRRSLDSLPVSRSELLWRQLQSEYYKAQEQTQDALYYLQRYVQLKDSLATATDSYHAVDMQKQFGYLSGEYELNMLKKQDEIKTIYLYALILFSIMVLVIFLLSWQYWKRSKKYTRELEELNQRISRQNEHLEESLSSLEQSQQDNTKMMKIAAHDLRNPVGSMVSTALYMEAYGAITDKDNLDSLKLIHQSGTHALELIDDLLHLNISAEMRKEIVEVDTALRYCVDLLQTKAKDKEQRIVVQLFPVTLLASREKIWRVFSNLITNAIKFSQAGSTIEVAMQLSGDCVRVSVKDEGMGIPGTLQAKLFNLTQDAKRSGTAGEESFGLGLAISKQIVEAHGGKIWFESEEGKGSTFYVELPLNAGGQTGTAQQ